MMEELHDIMKRLLANTFVLYMKAHSYHWNVTGPDFPQLHEFYGDLYEELHSSIDEIAEQLRTIRSFVPGTLSRIVELSTIMEDENISKPENMAQRLVSANEEVMSNLREAYNKAEEASELGLSNFLQDRLTVHAKYGWMLRSIAGIAP
jgi:starvation-inducible DNA-binding protein